MNLLFAQSEAVVETVNEAVETATQQAPAGGGMSFWIMIIAMIAIMYFFMWRPESKRRKQMQNFRDNLKKGDKIITAGGIYGVIKEVQPASVLVEVDSNVTLRIDKNMIVGDPAQGVVEKK
ncbi:MAG: preprotein translocase subunit YajC [Alistipes sp.]|nr:preprotein translocase subunit YajC [Alistipes sp.]